MYGLKAVPFRKMSFRSLLSDIRAFARLQKPFTLPIRSIHLVAAQQERG
jgi:hypothetical protein